MCAWPHGRIAEKASQERVTLPWTFLVLLPRRKRHVIAFGVTNMCSGFSPRLSRCWPCCWNYSSSAKVANRMFQERYSRRQLVRFEFESLSSILPWPINTQHRTHHFWQFSQLSNWWGAPNIHKYFYFNACNTMLRRSPWFPQTPFTSFSIFSNLFPSFLWFSTVFPIVFPTVFHCFPVFLQPFAIFPGRWPLSGEPSPQQRPGADEAGASHVAHVVVAQKRRGDGRRRRCGGHEQLPGTAVRTEDGRAVGFCVSSFLVNFVNRFKTIMIF